LGEGQRVERNQDDAVGPRDLVIDELQEPQDRREAVLRGQVLEALDQYDPGLAVLYEIGYFVADVRKVVGRYDMQIVTTRPSLKFG